MKNQVNLGPRSCCFCFFRHAYTTLNQAGQIFLDQRKHLQIRDKTTVREAETSARWFFIFPAIFKIITILETYETRLT